MAATENSGDETSSKSDPTLTFTEAATDKKKSDLLPPYEGYEPLMMVGLGGSAGSIHPLQTFFNAMPADSGMVFVVILHLAPKHESLLPDLLQRATSMRVVAAQDGVKVEPNCVYVIPPAKHIAAVDGHLRLKDLPSERRGKPITIDLFFRTLAESHGPQAAAIVLSGSDGDGSSGIKRIKEHGGLTIAQHPEEAEFAEMPRSAIATGVVDWVLKVSEMPRRLTEFQKRGRILALPPEGAPASAFATDAGMTDENTVREVLTFLRLQTKRDFSSYKQATVLRRIARRMQVNAIDQLSSYLTFLRSNSEEPGALLRDLLISVTNFFRDAGSFAALAERIPSLFSGKRSEDAVRVWVTACATGEEAYSIAILLNEYARTLEWPPNIQVFATDLNGDGIQVARRGFYHETIALDVSEERLRRYFVPEDNGYFVRRELRETILFAPHDLLKDPPFSHLDLITCRNFLIYLNRSAQNALVDIFHFALRPNGTLFLGSSESLEDENRRFAGIDKKHRLYVSQRSSPVVLSTALNARGPLDTAGAQLILRDFPPVSVPFNTIPASVPRRFRRGEHHSVSWGELHHKIFEQYGAPSVLINKEREIVHLSASAGRILEVAGGEPTRSLLLLAPASISSQLREALHRSRQLNQAVDIPESRVTLKEGPRLLRMRVVPVDDIAPGFFLVTFIITEASAESSPPLSPGQQPPNNYFERELEELKSRMENLVHESDASNEDLKASNEELQSMNEELRSATEELETSREELQSINEELTTVNQELKLKVDQLADANGDLHNMIVSTSIASVFLDRELRIKRYTPTSVDLFHLIPSDMGRPLEDITSRLITGDLTGIVKRVLQSLEKAEFEVQSKNGLWYLARVLPYRSMDDKIDGVILSFFDITSRKTAESTAVDAKVELNAGRATEKIDRRLAEESLRDSEERFNTLRRASAHFFRLNAEFTERRELRDGDSTLVELETVQTWLARRVHADDHTQITAAFSQAKEIKHVFEIVYRTKLPDGTAGWTRSRLAPRLDAQGNIVEWFGVDTDITEARQAKAEIKQVQQDFESHVKRRTAELDKANRALLDEIAERQRSEGERHAMLGQLVAAQEEERRRISRGLHDEVGQELTALILGLRALTTAGDSTAPATAVRGLQALAENVARDIHGLALELRPTSLDDLGLERTLASYIEEWSARSKVASTFHCVGLDGTRFPQTMEIALYRIVCETLNNVFKHADAKHVSVILEKRLGEAVAIVEDDGKGFDASKMDHHSRNKNLGLYAMRERALQLGGKVDVESHPNRGTTVFVRLPIRETEPPAHA